jgi:hypothetical protein
MRLIEFFYSSKRSGLAPLSQAEYIKDLVDVDVRIAEAAFQKAWETRNFEIELYWKRATYFWAFIASAFAGYFALVSSENYEKADPHDHVEVYVLICIGLIVSLAWVLTNKGSKSWQRHWEVHVDLLEDQFTGPLYKTVNPDLTYSVSKINEIVSISICASWILLGWKYFVDQDLMNLLPTPINWFVLASTVGTVLLVVAMFLGHGRGRFSEREVQMHRRKTSYKEHGQSSTESSAKAGLPMNGQEP